MAPSGRGSSTLRVIAFRLALVPLRRPGGKDEEQLGRLRRAQRLGVTRDDVTAPFGELGTDSGRIALG